MDFERYIGIDWSGAGSDQKRVALRVVEATASGELRSISPPTSRRAKNWTRREVRQFLEDALRADAPKTLVGVDAALGYPAGAAREVFAADSWREMIERIHTIRCRTQGLTGFVDAVNGEHVDKRGVPFYSRRKDIPERSWWCIRQRTYGFFIDTGVSYYRLLENYVPQSISAFYMGPGAMVAGHIITCLSVLHQLLSERDDRGELDFSVWLHETDWRERKHLVAECYPALYPRPDSQTAQFDNQHSLDAAKIAAWLSKTARNEALQSYLDVEDSLQAELGPIITEEGWVLGVPAPKVRPQFLGGSSR